MWATILEALIPFAIKMIVAYLGKKQDNTAAVVAFKRFISIVQAKESQSLRLKSSYARQLEILNKMEPGA